MSEENLIIEQQPDMVSTKPKRVKRPKSKARKIIEWIFFGIFAVFAIFILAGNISGAIHKKENYGQSIRFGIGSFVILTSSMEPDIPKDSAILTYKESCDTIFARYQSGVTQDITFANVAVSVDYTPTNPQYTIPVVANRVMTHRLVEMAVRDDHAFGNGRFVFITAGINPNEYGSEKNQYQIFTEKEYLGTVKLANTALGKVFNFIVSPIGLILVLLVPAAYLIVASSIDIFRALKTSEEENSELPTDNRLDHLSESEREKLKKELLDEMINSKRKEKEDGHQD